MTGEMITAEQLHRLYIERRSGQSETTKTASISPDEFVIDDRSTIAEQVYKRYRETRAHDREACIDAILDFIQGEQAVSGLSVETEKSGSSSAAGSLSISNVKQGRNSSWSWRSMFKYPLLDYLHASGSRLGLAMSIAVVGLLATAVLLLSPGKTQYNYAVPVSTGNHSAKLVDFVDKKDPRSLSFASGYTAEKSAFRRGLLAADLAIATHAQDQAVQVRILERVASLATEEGQITLQEDAGSLLSMLADSVHAAPTAQTSDAGNDGVVPNTGSPIQIENLINMLQSPALETEHEGWFEQGYALQTIAAAAQLQQATGISQPLYDSLKFYQNLDNPQQGLPASRMLQSFKESAVIPVASAEAVQSIITTTRDIKIVMQ